MEKLVVRSNNTYDMGDSVTGFINGDTILHTEFDDNKLVFKFCCKEEYFCPRHFEYNKPLFDGDIVELMISLGSKKKYLEIEVNQNNAQYCVLIDNFYGKHYDVITKLPKTVIESEVKIEKNYWECVIIIKTKDLVELGWQKDDCYMNAHRQSYDKNNDMKQYSLGTPIEPNFHVVDAFVKLDVNSK